MAARRGRRTIPAREDDGGGGGRFGGTPAVPRKAGLNNFAWDLRYPGAKGFQGMILWGAGRAGQGPMAVPGPYRCGSPSTARR